MHMDENWLCSVLGQVWSKFSSNHIFQLTSIHHVFTLGLFKVLLTAAAVHAEIKDQWIAWHLHGCMVQGLEGRGLIIDSGNGPTAYGIDDRRSRLASLRHPTTLVECGKDTLLDADDARCDNLVIAMYQMINRI